MSDRTAPLTALRAFEAAARHRSFAKAAEELNVTPAALSFQILSLEEHLVQPVFRRLNRAVELTEVGHALQPGLAEGFAALNAAWSAARRRAAGRSLTVTAGPAFTARWLSPRFFDFARAHPDIELRFVASMRFADFDRDEVDVAIRYTSRPSPGLYCRKLFREWVTPMMTPEIAARCRSPEDLLRETRLRQDDVVLRNPHVGWAEWFTAASLRAPADEGPHFSQADHAIDAALAGAGVVLGRVSLAHNALRSGQLVAPFDLALTNGTDCRFLCAPGQETRPDIAAFHDWIRSEVEEMERFSAGRLFVDAATIGK